MIRTRNLSKRFMIYDRPLDRFIDWMAPGGRRRGREFWALRQIDIEVPDGRAIGIVGVNGAGKSTLLKILTGTIQPTTGSFEIQGRVSSLLELGTGFHPEFTGRQNLIFNGKLAGLSEAELAERIDPILAFAELGDFIDQPLRTYSSGMVLRLGFALASSVDPEVLIVDEALAVGDLHFQQKCLRRIRRLHDSGVTILFVSHDPGLIKNFCTEAILLDEGRIIDRGAPDAVLDYYTALLAEKYRDGAAATRIIRPRPQNAQTESAHPASPHEPATPQQQPDSIGPPFRPLGHRTGNFRVVLTSVFLEERQGAGPVGLIVTGRQALLHLRAVALDPVESVTVGIAIKDRLGQELYGVNTAYLERDLGPLEPNQILHIQFDLPMNLGPGLYSLTAALHAGRDHTETCYDWAEQALSFQVLPDPTSPFTGLVRLEPAIEVQTQPAAAEELDRARQTARSD